MKLAAFLSKSAVVEAHRPTPSFFTAVTDSEDLQRILALPRRPRPSPEVLEGYVSKWTALLRQHDAPPCSCAKLNHPCILRLRSIQAWYLEEAANAQSGVLGHIAVGVGKTGLDCLLPMVVPGVRRAVLLIPPNLRVQFAHDFELWRQHWKVPNLAGDRWFVPGRPVLRVLAYSELSHKKAATFFAANTPDLIIGDESHALGSRKSTRTNRFIRYIAEAQHPVRFCGHSGSLTARSLDDYAHLSALALGLGSPLPLDPSVVKEWGTLLDPQCVPAQPGAFAQFCAPGEAPRAAFCRRRNETPGVVTSEDAEIATRLTLAPFAVKVPEKIRTMLAEVRARQQRPDGEELVDAVEVAATCRQVSSGFYYRWKFPRGEPPALIEEWFKVRKEWHRELREKLIYRVDHMDSPDLCADAAKRYHAGYKGDLPVWASQWWVRWNAISKQVVPAQDTVWVDDFLAEVAAGWAREQAGIVWFLHRAFGRRAAELAGCPYYGEGQTASAGISTETGTRSVVASIRAHGEGKNLQYAFSRNLVAELPSNGKAYEQLFGRTHRSGQAARVVTVEVAQHTPELREALVSAREHAKYVQSTTGKLEKLLYAEQVPGGWLG